MALPGLPVTKGKASSQSKIEQGTRGLNVGQKRSIVSRYCGLVKEGKKLN